MPCQRTDCRTGAGFATRVGDLGAEEGPQTRFNESPRSHVFRFLLAPDKLRVFWIWLEHFAQLFLRQRIKLLDANECCVLYFAFTAILQKIVIHFTGAKDDTL